MTSPRQEPDPVPSVLPVLPVPDPGTPDSGTPDSGTPDSGTPDSGTPDSGTPDSGAPKRSTARRLEIPEVSLVVLIGISGSGKSTFAARHFARTEIISSDACRGMVCDDENDQAATPDAFELLHFIAAKRLAAGRLTVVDATNVQPDSRRQLVALAREHDVLPTAIVLDLPEQVCAARNASRDDRQFGAHVLRRQAGQLRRGLRSLQREGFRAVHVLRGDGEVTEASIVRTRLFVDKRDEQGPFDVLGDVHGCLDELVALLAELGYELRRDHAGRVTGARHPLGRRAVFLGDLVDRGPDTPGVLRLVMGMVGDGDAFCVSGNHDGKLLRALRGRQVRVSHGLAESLEQLAAQPAEFRDEVVRFLDGLISHYLLDGGRLVVAHAGLPERMHGRASGRVREFCLYGQTTGETDEFGLPVRYPWADDYRGRATVLYGHTPVPVPTWVNNTLCLDTGCVFGGRLSALRYPERELVSVPAARVYYAPAKPFPSQVDPSDAASAAAAPQAAAPAGAASGPAGSGPSGPGGSGSSGPGGSGAGTVAGSSASAVVPAVDAGSRAEPGTAGTAPAAPVARRSDPQVLDLRDVTGNRVLQTAHHGRVSVRHENAAAALEVMSRFAVDPRWLLYLPPTMSPVATSRLPGVLEHPEQAFDAYRAEGVDAVVCEEKHMGSRAVVLLCRDAAAAAARFGPGAEPAPASTAADAAAFPAADAAGYSTEAAPGSAAGAAVGPQLGAIWTRTGRPFFPPALTTPLLERLVTAAERAGLFDELGTSWLLLDAELMPWSAKAEELLRNQYASVGAAARTALPAATAALAQASAAGLDVTGLLERTRARERNALAFTAAYRRYCWPTDGLAGLQLAVFQVLAGEGTSYHDRPHRWHLARADRLADREPALLTTTRRFWVDTTDATSVAAGVRWWEGLTAAGGEGMVVKPEANLTRGPHGLVQPGLKVRGREYLRIIYGPDYTEPGNLERLRQRGLGRKRSLALREYALGLEALERVARGEPLWRVHECVFAVLALESEPVDPRL